MHIRKHAFLCQLLAVLFLVYPTTIYGQCNISVFVNPALSNFTLTGAVTKPIQAPLQPANPGVVSGLQGELTASLLGDCPTDAAALAAALTSAQLSTTPSTGALQFYPAQVAVEAAGLATLQWTDIYFNTSLTLAPSAAATLSMVISQGWTNSSSLVSPGGERIELTGVQATNTSTPQISQATSTTTSGGGVVVITVPTLLLTFPSSYNTTFGGAPLEGGADYILTGTLVLEAAVGCSAPCGENGRCSTAAEDGSSVGCECECGWGGADCSIPSGFCPRFPTEPSSSSAVCPVLPLTPAPPVPDGSSCGASLCTEFQEYNSTAGACACKEGWNGPGCDACETNAACSTFFSASSGTDVVSTCSTSRLYTSDTVYKAYSCDLTGTGLEGVLEPGSFYVSCNTTTGGVVAGGNPGTTPTVSDGSYCKVNFALKGRANNPITCKTSLCSFQSNSSTVNCQSTTCACRSACPDLDGVFTRINNQPSVIDCDENGQCVFDIQDFFITLKAPCTNHACLVEGYQLEEGAYTQTTDKDYNSLIAAVPLIALVAAAAFFIVFYLKDRAFFRSTSDAVSATTAAAAADSPPHLSPIDPVKELSYTAINSIVTTRTGDTRAILCNVSGVARLGELCGIVGPSGGGKTCLLSILAGSVDDQGGSSSSRSATLSGSVTLDGRPLDASSARRIAYCAQDCTLLPTLTVEESIRYSAILRLPRGTTSSEVTAIVTGVIADLGLTHVATSYVGGGSGIRGVSGGELRRVSIAMELVTNPAVIILDEPTSGLDSYTAYSMMSTLRSLADNGRIVMLSFHQPSPAMFSLLDRCVLLAQGVCVYSGTPGEVEAHFAAIGMPVPQGVGAAEHMLYCACDPETLPALLKTIGASSSNSSSPAAVTGTPSSTEDAESGGMASLENNEKQQQQQQSDPDGDGHRHSRAAAAAGISRELSVLFWRAWADIRRNPILLLLHWGMGIGMGLFTGCIFFAVGFDISGAQDRLGGCFFALAFFAFTSLTTVDLVMTERRIVAREVRGGYYHAASYLATKAVLDGLLLRVIPVFLYTASFYPMMGLVGGAGHVSLFLMVLSTFAVTIGALSLAVAVGSATAGRASLVMNLVLLISLLVGGFFVNTSSMPDWISWLHFVSPFFYAYAALTTNELSSILLNFEVEGYTAVQNVRGTTFLDLIGINADNLTQNIIILDCMYVIFLLLAFALLWKKMPKTRTLKASSS